MSAIFGQPETRDPIVPAVERRRTVRIRVECPGVDEDQQFQAEQREYRNKVVEFTTNALWCATLRGALKGKEPITHFIEWTQKRASEVCP